MEPKKTYMITIISGALIMVTGIILATYTSFTEKILQSGIITAGMVMIIIGFIRMIRERKGPSKDELTRKIADRSAAYSWVITLMTLLIIFWLNHFEVQNFTVNGVISVTYIVMIGSMILFQQIYWRKGDVE